MQYITIRQILDVKGYADVFTIRASLTLAEFVRTACEKKIGALVVAGDDGALAGIITERDVLYQCNKKVDFTRTKIADVMTKNILTIDINDGIQAAMDLMFSKNIRHLPVMDGSKIMGMITVKDVIRAIRKGDEDEKNQFMAYLQSSAEKAAQS
jgi:CBS domain-containing protein